jgi:hypothetical protein
MSKIIDAEDILEEVKGCVECLYMAASDLEIDHRDTILTVANIASKKIDEAIALLNEYRNAGADSEAYARAEERLRDYDAEVASRRAVGGRPIETL